MPCAITTQTSLNSMEDHHTRSYRAAFAAIAVAQFNVRKGVCGGPEGVRRLWQNPDSRQLMEWVLVRGVLCLWMLCVCLYL